MCDEDSELSEAALDEMQSFADDLDLGGSDSDSDGEGLGWPSTAAASDSDDDTATAAGSGGAPELTRATPSGSPLSETGGPPQALNPELEMRSRVDAMLDANYWRRLCPQVLINSSSGFAVDGSFQQLYRRLLVSFPVPF
jgi:hypothetical protein